MDNARKLLTLINPAHLKKVYTHRAARIILIKQEEILHRLVKEGTNSTPGYYQLPILCMYSLHGFPKFLRNSVGLPGTHTVRHAGRGKRPREPGARFS